MRLILSEEDIRKFISERLETDSTSGRSAVDIIRYGSGGSSYTFGGEDFEYGGYDGYSGPSSSVASSVSERAERLGKELGIDPAWIYAEEAKESSHNPNALAWNLHIAIRDKYSNQAGVSPLSSEDKEKMKAATSGFSYKTTESGGRSYFGDSARKAYAAAYKISPEHAIIGGAWGLYQILGAFSLPDYGSASSWESARQSDPVNHSEKALKSWIKSYGQDFKDAVNRGDYAYTTKKYYGAPNADYEKFIRQHVAKYKSGQVKSVAKLSEADLKDVVGKVIGRGINLDKLKDGKNNYRAALGPSQAESVGGAASFLERAKRDLGIKTVITLNSDSGGSKIAGLAEKAGLDHMFYPMGETDPLSRSKFNAVKKQLSKGDNLIHCTHGADRTGAVVGRYYIEENIMDVDEAVADTKKYGGHKARFPQMRSSLENGFA